MLETEMVLGPLPQDNPSGRWFRTKRDRSELPSYVRFYDGVFNEIIHWTTGVFCEETHSYSDGYTVSINHEMDGVFAPGYKVFKTTRDAQRWADNRSQEDINQLMIICEHLLKQARARTPAVEVEEAYNPGF